MRTAVFSVSEIETGAETTVEGSHQMAASFFLNLQRFVYMECDEFVYDKLSKPLFKHILLPPFPISTKYSLCIPWRIIFNTFISQRSLLLRAMMNLSPIQMPS